MYAKYQYRGWTAEEAVAERAKVVEVESKRLAAYRAEAAAAAVVAEAEAIVAQAARALEGLLA